MAYQEQHGDCLVKQTYEEDRLVSVSRRLRRRPHVCDARRRIADASPRTCTLLPKPLAMFA